MVTCVLSDLSSTPFRPSPTFHDELMECMSVSMSPMCPQQTSQPSSGDSMETADQSMDEFSKVLNETVSTQGYTCPQ